MGTEHHTRTEAIDTVQFLVGSEVRVRLLASLREQRQDARTLVDRLEVPHSTVQRNLTKLEERGWIDVTVNRRYYATPVGEMVLESLEGLLGTVDAVDGLAAFVDSVPFDDIGLDLDRLADADVVVADGDTPAAPLSEFVELLADSEGFTLATPHWNPAFGDVIERQLDARHDVELVTSQSQQGLLTGTGVAGLDDHLEDSNLTVKLTDESISFGIALVGKEVALLAYRDGALRVLVRSTDATVREWARARLNSIVSTSCALGAQAGDAQQPCRTSSQTNP